MNVLEKIVLDKREEVEARKKDFPVTGFIEQLDVSDRDFKQALYDDHANKGSAFILECKKASPSKGLIRPVFDLDEICSAYKNYASCVSVLTDEKYFQGEFERLPLVKQKLHQPVLCKDFFVDEYQVHLARYFGANAILLMLSVLSDEEYQALASVAKDYQMAILTEVSNEEEMHRAVKLKAEILGINNRNLRDLSTDLNKTPELVELFNSITDKQQQDNTILISESGIYNKQQVNLLLKHAKGFLVGSSLMAEDDLQQACHDLIVGEHKVCGLKQAEMVKAAKDAGAKYQGLIFVESSPRAVSEEQALNIKQQVPEAKLVAVVVNKPISELIELINKLKPAAVQLHGQESQDYINELKQQIPKDTQIWKAIAVSNALPDNWPNVDKIVLDTKAPNGQSGGTGTAFDWRILKDIDFTAPNILLAGGIQANNLDEALAQGAVGLDINSGVETSPGEKSKEKITELFNRINNRN